MTDFKGDRRKSFYLTLYILIAAFTVALVAALAVWVVGDGADLSEAASAEVVLDFGVRREYLAGEEVAKDGVKLSYGGEIYGDCAVSCDTSSAGVKRVEVTYKSDDRNLVGYYTVKVYKARHFDLRVHPTGFYTEGDEIKYDGRFVLWADLNDEPKEFTIPADYGTVVVVPPSSYKVDIRADGKNEGCYTATLSIGTQSLSYYFVDLGTQVFMLNSADRVLDFVNTNGGQEKLQLFVTNIVLTQEGSISKRVYGYYVFTASDNTKSVYRFEYYLEGYTSNFVSSKFNEGLTDAYDPSDEGFNATVGGLTFHADRAGFHKAVLGE